jgi:serine/threonine-protein kinase RsbW
MDVRFPEGGGWKRHPAGGSGSRPAGKLAVMPPVARGFEFKLTAEADNVPVVRRALHALLRPAELSPDRIASITLATTEVCANVVRHAYPDGDHGVIRVEAILEPDGQVTVVVRDHGVGMSRRTDAVASAIGLSISAAIASDLRIDSSGDVGTEVRMIFAPQARANPGLDLGTPMGE